MLLQLWNFLQNRKTYIVAVLTLIYATLGLWLHFMTMEQAMPYFLAGLGVIGFRSALKKLQ